MKQDIENIKQQLEEVINKNLPEKGIKWMQEGNYSHKNKKGYTDGFNQALSQINTSLIADEVLKVVKKEIFGENLDEVDMTTYGWILLLLDNLSPNKENKNNG